MGIRPSTNESDWGCPSPEYTLYVCIKGQPVKSHDFLVLLSQKIKCTFLRDRYSSYLAASLINHIGFNHEEMVHLLSLRQMLLICRGAIITFNTIVP